LIEFGVFGDITLGFTLGRLDSGYMALCPRLRFREAPLDDADETGCAG
jgi:hypothetical protein